tara:strand:- start:79291 stop:79470 length:180 start_codon:yes stop_codon:yes gene_type:complete
MKEQLNALLENQIDQIEPNNMQAMMMGGAFVGLNLILMVSVSLYWINPSIHQFISGRPL